MYPMIPLMVNCTGKCVVIFGGGEVGARKAAFFKGEAKVKVVSRSFSPKFSEMKVRLESADLDGADDVELMRHLDGAFLAIAATPDSDLNERIGRCAASLGVLFNNARGKPGDLFLPAVTSGEHFVLAISTRGASPAVARYLREFIEERCPHLDGMISLQGRLRRALPGRVPDQADRRRILEDVLHDQTVWSALGSGEDAAWKIIGRRYLIE
jgi:precorrin-2 dehydrogenase/sirohydrochlorin ferrochelatase